MNTEFIVAKGSLYYNIVTRLGFRMIIIVVQTITGISLLFLHLEAM